MTFFLPITFDLILDKRLKPLIFFPRGFPEVLQVLFPGLFQAFFLFGRISDDEQHLLSLAREPVRHDW